MRKVFVVLTMPRSLYPLLDNQAANAVQVVGVYDCPADADDVVEIARADDTTPGSIFWVKTAEHHPSENF